MGTKRRDRLGDVYGVATVVGSQDKSTWIVRWGCCDRIQVITNDRAIGLSKTFPKRCIVCARSRATKADERRAQHRRQEARVAAREVSEGTAGIMLGRDWWPYLTKMGPRYGRGATYDS